MTPIYFTLWDFCLRQNRLADYPSLLSQEHNIRLTVRSVALAHPNSLSANFVKLNINRNFIFGLQEVYNDKKV